jgi:hypothetical protein
MCKPSADAAHNENALFPYERGFSIEALLE